MNPLQKKSRLSVISQKQTGLTLVELMVAMAISLFILIAIALVYQSSKNGFAYSNNTVRMSEDSSFAIDSLSRDIRMAGYGGCTGLSATNGPDGIPKNLDDVYIPNLDNVKTLPLTGTDLPNPFSKSIFNAREALLGYKNATTAGAAAATAGTGAASFLTTSTSYDIVATAPILFLSGGSNKAVQLNAAIVKNQKLANIVNDVNKWSNNGSDILMLISDCKNSEIFRTFGLQASGAIQSENNFLNDYGSDAIVTPVESSTYFLATRKNATTSSLYRRYFNGKVASGAEEIVPNVEAITFQYGLNTTCVGSLTCISPNTTPTYVADIYVKDTDANFATMDWSRVVSVRMGLIMVTEDNGQTTKNSTTGASGDEIDWVDGKYKVPTADRRLRRAYSTTVSIRNRGSF
jgi:type IV pilus assembly protein PilW